MLVLKTGVTESQVKECLQPTEAKYKRQEMGFSLEPAERVQPEPHTDFSSVELISDF